MESSARETNPGAKISAVLRKKRTRKILAFVAFAVVMIAAGAYFFRQQIWLEPSPPEVSIGRMNTDLAAGKVARIKVLPDFLYQQFVVELKDSAVRYRATGPKLESRDVRELQERGVEVDFVKPPLDLSSLPHYLLIFVLLSAMLISVAQSLGISFTRASRRSSTRFADVAGNTEAKEALGDVVQYLRDPRAFEAIGARFPRGIIMDGPPGTGKTLLGRAVAGEANANFIACSGSDFSSAFVGVTGMKIRALFARARRSAPCVIFIDEIDAVGGKRLSEGTAIAREMGSILNSMLVQMDGFAPNNGVVVIAATNRLELLDPALLRSGRFDRQLHIRLPNLHEREEVLLIHGKRLDPAVFDFKAVAKACVGMSGADLENVVNQAALIAVREGATAVRTTHGLEARDRLLMGDARPAHSKGFDERTRRILATHETGHAIVGMVHGPDPVTRVSIVPRGQSLGQTIMTPGAERVLHEKSLLLDHVRLLLGGRAAEMLICGTQTTGAADDLKRASAIVQDLVGTYGMHTGLLLVSERSSDALRERAERSAEEILAQLLGEATSTIERHRLVFEEMARELAEVEDLDEGRCLVYRNKLRDQSKVVSVEFGRARNETASDLGIPAMQAAMTDT